MSAHPHTRASWAPGTQRNRGGLHMLRVPGTGIASDGAATDVLLPRAGAANPNGPASITRVPIGTPSPATTTPTPSLPGSRAG